jgi:hypothetical protein
LHQNPVRTQNSDKKALNNEGPQNEIIFLNRGLIQVELIIFIDLRHKVLICYLQTNIENDVRY